MSSGPGPITVDLQLGVFGLTRSGSADHISGIEQIDGTPFGDVLLGGPSKDSFVGDDGDDYLDGQGGYDYLEGSGGTDVCLNGEEFDDLMSCEATTVAAD